MSMATCLVITVNLLLTKSYRKYGIGSMSFDNQITLISETEFHVIFYVLFLDGLVNSRRRRSPRRYTKKALGKLYFNNMSAKN